MQKISFITICMLTSIMALSYSSLHAGNKQRAGQAGGGQLLINPWARSSGMGGAGSSSCQGLEAQFMNVAGTAFTRKTELLFTNTQLLVGSGIKVNAFGLSQKLGESGVLSLSVMTMNYGDIEITTVDLPEGGLGMFHPHNTNVSISFAKAFSNTIFGGATFKVVNEGVSDVKATGVAFDLGVQYVTGMGKDKAGNKQRDNFKFGIAMKNVGSEMKFSGDGMSFRGETGSGVLMTNEYRSAGFELPSLIMIGISYDLDILANVDSANSEVISDHKIRIAANFTSNSFTKDQYHLGLEYCFKNMVFLRGGYVMEEDIFNDELKRNVYTGPTAGASVQIPLNKERGSSFSIDYSYRATDPFAGTHSIGARINL